MRRIETREKIKNKVL